MKVLWVIAQYR